MNQRDQQAAIDALDSQVEEIRHQALRRLGEVFEVVPLDLVIRALGDQSWRLRKAAVQLALRRPIDEELLGRLTACLGEEDNAGLRNSATEVFVQLGPPVIPTIAGLLAAGDRDERKFAADILGEIGHADAVDALLGALGDEDDNVRGAAAEACGRIGDPRCEAQLQKVLVDDQLLVQMSCLDALERMNSEVPFELLLPLLQVRPLRHLVFGLLGDQRGGELNLKLLPALLEGLGSRGRTERSAAACALLRQYRRAEKQVKVEIQVSVTRAASDELCQGMRSLLDSGEAEEREAAIAVLGWTGREDVVADLIPVAADERLRQAVADAVLAIGPRGAGALSDMLDELGRSEKVLVMELLGHFQRPESLPRIVEMALSEEPEVAEAAQRALGQMGDPSVLATLVELLERGGEGMAQGAVVSLVLVGDRFHDEVLRSIEPLLSSEKSTVRRGAAEVLSGMAHRADQARLESLVGDEDPAVRLAAIRALGRVGGDEVVDRLRIILADESPEVRAAAARALGSRSGDGARQALKLALRDEDAWVVAEALAGLGQSGAEDMGDAVGPFVAHPDGAVALQAVRALNRIGWGADEQRMMSACGHADPEVVKETIAGCGSWPVAVAREALSKTIDDPRWDVRVAAAKKIGSMHQALGRELLLRRLAQENDGLVKETLDRMLRLTSSDAGS